MSELYDMMEWEKLNKLKPDISTNVKDDEYAVVELEKNPFYDCKYGYIYSVPEHNLYQSMCKLKNTTATCEGCKDFCKKEA